MPLCDNNIFYGRICIKIDVIQTFIIIQLVHLLSNQLIPYFRVSGIMSSNKVAVVTGSNKGIGFAIVKGLCENYDGTVYLTARDSNRGQEAVNKLKTLGYNSLFYQLDITDQNSVNNFRDYIKTKHGGLDVLVNNAGVFANNSLPVAEQARQNVDVNYFGTLRVSNALSPLLRLNGRIVNVSSSLGRLNKISSPDIQRKFTDPHLTIANLSELMKQYLKDVEENTYQTKGWGELTYAVSKLGVTVLTILQQNLFDQEDPNRHISVNAVDPGYVITDMTGNKGELTVEQGAKAPLFLALNADLKGKYVSSDCGIVEWDAPATQ